MPHSPENYAHIELDSGGARLALSGCNGAVVALTAADGSNRVVPAAEAFTVQLLDGNGNPTRLASSDFAFAHDGACLEWCHASGLRVRMGVTAADGEFRFRPSVEGILAGMLLEWFDGPQICIASDRILYWPFWDGCEVTDFRKRRERYRPAGYSPRYVEAMISLYPGFCQMQFLAAYRDGEGIYFSAVDDRHTPKGVDWEIMDDATVRLSLQTFCGDLTDGAWRPAFHYSLRPYAGGWMEACEIYRDWIRTLPGFERPPARPEWMRDSPVNLIYPVRGEGLDHSPRDMKPNRYFPYVSAMPAVERYGRLLDSRIMALVMHWEGTAPWAPPYVWPPLGGETELAKFRDALHGRGDLLGVYCSGTAWTQISCILPRYSLEQRFEDEHLGRHMMRGPKGEITAAICNHIDHGQRLGYDMCLAEDWSIRTIEEEVGKMARFGIDYCQFFDQNLGGGWLLCYAKHHSHPPIPGAWATDAMSALQRRLVASAGSCGMTLGCEAAAATPYVPNLFYNDSRPMIDMFYGRPVHGMAFVFHEWSCNFSGNQCGIFGCDPFWRWQYSFHNGDMLSLILGDDNGLVAAWCHPWSEEFPEQEALVSLVKRLNDFRKEYPSFLLEGRMIRPFARCESRPAQVGYAIWGAEGAVDTTEVLTSFWENAEGERIGFASNWRQEPSGLTVTYPDGRVETHRLTPLETIVLAPGEMP